MEEEHYSAPHHDSNLTAGNDNALLWIC